MTHALATAATAIVVWGAYLRFGGVMYAHVRALLLSRRFLTFKRGWRELVCYPEPFLLVATTYVLQSGAAQAPADAWTLPARLGGAAVTLAGWALIVWTWLSWPGIFGGHGILADHALVTRGAYAVVRHPIYLGAFFVWLGLAVGLRSAAAFLLTTLYVIPAYLLYIGSEETMLRDAFGAAYERYRAAVPMLVPRWPSVLHLARRPASPLR